MRANSVEYLITKGLGYCCRWWFFQLYKNNELIAARLGTKERAIRYNRFIAEACEHSKQCALCRTAKNKAGKNPPASTDPTG